MLACSVELVHALLENERSTGKENSSILSHNLKILHTFYYSHVAICQNINYNILLV